MIKIFSILFFSFFLFSSTYAVDELKIISREEWGAVDEYIDRDSETWKNIIENKLETGDETSENEINRINEFIAILKENYKSFYSKTSKIYQYNGVNLAWPIQKSEKIRSIVIHHTHSDFQTGENAIQNIYKYHSVSNEWGDIGYNFLIGYNGEIYEGRLGGETAVAAHTKRNNIQSIGIALIGDYENIGISQTQYENLEKLVEYLVEKYDINLLEKTIYHRNCIDSSCETYLTTEYNYRIIGHRDAGHTDCPGEELYKQIQNIREKLEYKQKLEKQEEYRENLYNRFDKIGEDKLLLILLKLDDYLIEKPQMRLGVLKLKKYINDYLKTI